MESRGFLDLDKLPETHDRAGRRVHRLRTGLHGGDARREGDDCRVARRHSAVARSRCAARSAQPHGKEPRHPRPDRQGAGEHQGRRQRRARQFRRRSARSRLAAVRRRPQAGHRRVEAGKRRAEDQRARLHRGGRLLPHQRRQHLRHRRCDRARSSSPTTPPRKASPRRRMPSARSRASTKRSCRTSSSPRRKSAPSA